MDQLCSKDYIYYYFNFSIICIFINYFKNKIFLTTVLLVLNFDIIVVTNFPELSVILKINKYY